MVGEGCAGFLASGRCHGPPALQRVAQGCHLCLIREAADTSRTSGWFLQGSAAKPVLLEEEQPWGHRELAASLVCVWSPMHKPGPEGFSGKGQSLLGRVSASLSVAAAVAGCFIVSRRRLLSLLTGNCTQLQQGKTSLNYLTCKGYLNENFKLPFILP